MSTYIQNSVYEFYSSQNKVHHDQSKDFTDDVCIVTELS